ncbi:MAG: hypothetical protein HY318_11410 [Armatimonadetes bacterium]|nr:hypothetical protein [Armatimonadota bacterium]
MKRLLKLAPIVVPLVVLSLVGLHTFRKSASLPSLRQRLVLSQMSRMLRADVSASRITGDWWTGITFHNLVVSKDRTLPGGALFRARRLRVRYPLRAILKGKVSAVGGIKDITVFDPVVNVRRDAHGKWNLKRLIPPPGRPRRREFRARIVVRNARVIYRDEMLRSRQGEIFARDLRSVNAVAQFNGEDPVTFKATARDAGGKVIHPTTVGEVTADGKYVEATTRFEQAEAAFFLPYFLKSPDLHVTSARARGVLRLVWVKSPNPKESLSLAGDVTLTRASFDHRKARFPFRNVQGRLRFMNQQMHLQGVSGQFGDSHFTVNGDVVGLSRPVYALSFESDHLNVAELMGLATKKPGTLRVSTSGYAKGRFDLVGGLSVVSVSGEAAVPPMKIAVEHVGRIKTAAARVRGSVDDLLHPTFDGSVVLPSIAWQSFGGDKGPSPLSFRGIRNVRLQVRDLPSNPVVVASLDVAEGEAGRVPFEHLHVNGEFRDRIIRIPKATFMVAGGGVETSGRVDLREATPTFSFNGTASQVSSQLVDRFLQGRNSCLTGLFTGPFQVAGSPDEVTVTTHLFMAGFHATPHEESQMRFIKDFDGQDFELTARGRWQRVNDRWEPEMEGQARSREGLLAFSKEPYKNLSFENIEGHFTLRGNDLCFGYLTASLLGGKGAVSGSLNIDNGDLGMQIAGVDWDLTRVTQVGLEKDWRGLLNFRGDLSGSLYRPEFAGKVELVDGDLEGLPISYGVTELSASSEQVSVRNGVLHEFGARYLINGSLSNMDWQQEDGHLDFKVRAESLGVSRLVGFLSRRQQSQANASKAPPFFHRLSDQEGAITGVGEASIDVSGTLRHPEGKAALLVHSGGVFGIPVDHLEASASYANDRLELSRLLGSTNGATFAAQGAVESNTSIHIDFEGSDVPSVYAARPVGLELPIAGSVHFKGRIGGTTLSPNLEVSVDSAPLTLSGRGIGRLGGNLSVDATGVRCHDLALVDEETRVNLVGEVPFGPKEPEMHLTVDAHQVPLQDLVSVFTDSTSVGRQRESYRRFFEKTRSLVAYVPESVEGHLQARLDFTGSHQSPEMAMSFEVRDGRLPHKLKGGHDLILPVTAASTTWRGGVLRINSFRATQGDAEMSIKAGSEINPEKELNLDFDIYNMDLNLFKDWFEGLPDVGGIAKLVAVQAVGPISKPSVLFTADVEGFRVGSVAFDKLSTNVVRVTGEEIHIEEDDLSLIKGGHTAFLWGTVPIDWQKHSIPRDRPIDLHAKKEHGDLAVLPLFVKGIEKAAGRFDAGVALTGTLNDPKLRGKVSVSEGSLKLAKWKKPIEHVEADLEGDPSSGDLELKTLSGKMGEGSFVTKGTIGSTAEGLRDLTRNRYALDLQTHRLPFEFEKALQGVFSVDSDLRFITDEKGEESLRIARLDVSDSKGGALRVTKLGAQEEASISLVSDWTQTGKLINSRFDVPLLVDNFYLHAPKLIKGRVNATDLRLTSLRNGTAIPLTLTGKVSVSNMDVIGFPETEGQFLSWNLPPYPELALRIDLDRNVNIDTARIRVKSMQGFINLKDTLAQPTITGTLMTQRGTLDFPGSDARLRNAQVGIRTVVDPDTGKSIPVLDIDAKAEANLDKYRLLIAMRQSVVPGKPNQTFDIHVESSPPMPGGEGTALRKLLGLPPEQLVAEGDVLGKQVYQSFAGLFQEIPVFKGLEDFIKTAFRIETFDVDYSFDKPINVRVGKDIAKGLFLSYRRTISGPRSGYALRLDYRVRGNTVLSFEADDRGFSQYNIERVLAF